MLILNPPMKHHDESLLSGSIQPQQISYWYLEDHPMTCKCLMTMVRFLSPKDWVVPLEWPTNDSC